MKLRSRFLSAGLLLCALAAAHVPASASESAMPSYDPTEHPRLSSEAATLAQPVLDAYADEAEALFGIAGTNFSNQAHADLTLAVVRQVNLTVRLDQHGAGAVATESKGDQSVTLARNPKTGLAVQVDVIAQQIVDRVLAGAAAEAGTSASPIASSSTPIVFTW